jgi:hypothetical protein
VTVKVIKNSDNGDDDYDGPSASQKCRLRARLEVSDSDVNIHDDRDGDDG